MRLPGPFGKSTGDDEAPYSAAAWAAFAKSHGLSLRNSYYLPNPVVGLIEGRPFTLLPIRSERMKQFSVMSLALNETLPLDLRMWSNDSSAAVSRAKRALGITTTSGDESFDDAVAAQARNVERALRYLTPARRDAIRKALATRHLTIHSGELHARLPGIPTDLASLNEHLNELTKWARVLDNPTGTPAELRAAS